MYYDKCRSVRGTASQFDIDRKQVKRWLNQRIEIFSAPGKMKAFRRGPKPSSANGEEKFLQEKTEAMIHNGITILPKNQVL